MLLIYYDTIRKKLKFDDSENIVPFYAVLRIFAKTLFTLPANLPFCVETILETQHLQNMRILNSCDLLYVLTCRFLKLSSQKHF